MGKFQSTCQISADVRKRLHTLEKAVCIAFLLSMLFSMLGFKSQCEDISDRVLRLHVLANSDTGEDQELKLKVRDRILKEADGMLEKAVNRASAEEILAPQLELLEAAAQDEINRQGYSYPVKVELANMYFTTRQYETVTLPAGMYDAVRVTIGEGKGKNWWCVLFPPMCLSAATQQQELEAVLTPEENEIVQESSSFEVKFKVVEWWESACQWFRSLTGQTEEYSRGCQENS